MDVQKESMDPLPCESQSSGKIRKGFKLFGKRKPGNIFTIRNKGDGHNKSPVNKSKSLDGLSETGEADLVQEPDTDRGQEVSQGEMEQREEEALGEDGIQAFAHSRNSISSTSSARSLKFLSLLRGGRLGTGDRRVHTVSQPVGRQRRGLKGLFGTVRLRSKDKDGKGEVPPSPLLKSSRANSVEIIKEDLTLTPKVQPRLLDSPEQENTEPVESVSSQDSTPTTPPATVASRVPTDNVSRADEYVPPLPTSQPPLEPGDNSLNNLLADISSLLTFESISGGGDVIANVEAEWGKANATSKPTSPLYKPLTPSALTSTNASYASVEKASSVAITMAVPTKTLSPPAQTTSSTAPALSAVVTTTKASALATSSDTLSSGFTATLSTTSIIKSSPTLAARKPSWAHVTTESISPTSSSPLLTKSTRSFSTTTATTVPINTSTPPVKVPSVRPAVTFTVSTLPSETEVSPQPVPLEIKPSQVTTPPPALPPVTHSPPAPVAFTKPSYTKLDFVSNPKLQTSTTVAPSSAGGESKEPVVATTTTIRTSYFEPLVCKMATLSSSTTTDSVFGKPALTSAEMDSNQPPTSLATVPRVCPSPILTFTLKTEPSPPPVSETPSTTSNELPDLTKEKIQLCIDEVIPAPVTPATIITETPTSTDTTPNLTSQFKSITDPPQTADSVAKDPPQTPPDDSKEPPALIETVQSILSFAVDQIKPEDPPALKTDEDVLVSLAKVSPAPDSESAVILAPLSAPIPSPDSSLSSPSWPSEAPSKTGGSGEISLDEQVGSSTSNEPPRAQTVPSKKGEQHNASQVNLKSSSKEGKTHHAKPSGLSKIPVVGGGRAGKLPVRERQHVDNGADRGPPTPETEKQRPHFNSHDAGGKNKSPEVGTVGLTSKRTQERSQQPPQPKALTSSPRDTKIPMKHSPHPHYACQIPVARDTPRTKIPVSRVPVRRAGNKPADASGSSQIRK
ncbi:APC membrane recruitment protein 2 [Takifugu flavidus]|uniref:APC membrane recruitment protein 2 n=1 Tax=Takifugu flavidus TaxID=433684 RepID=A0A5C6P4Q6_9TELE|nr:APC membrane recruitment protein 2 [Takifugu flavidus]